MTAVSPGDADQPVLKGQLRIMEQIRHLGRDHLLAVAYHEFTADIPLNRVFRFVIERLWLGTHRRLCVRLA